MASLPSQNLSCFMGGFCAEKSLRIWVRFIVRHWTDGRNGFLSAGLDCSPMQVAIQVVDCAPPWKPFALLARTMEAVVHLGSASTQALALGTAPAFRTALEMASAAVEKYFR